MRRHNNNLFSLTALAAFLFSPLAIAQDDFAVADDGTINVEAQPLAAALKDFSDQTGLQLAYVATLAENKTSNGVESAESPNDALDAILDSTGLEYQFVNDETVAIGVADERGASDSKNLETVTPILMAQNQTSPTQTTVSSRSEEGGTSIVTGKVTDARTGANLKGAKVAIEETGQWTSTNDLGEFRFVNVPTGSVTLTVSYLGYAGQSAEVGVRGDGTSRNFALRGGSEIEEIVVYGSRSARSLSLNQERTAENFVTVLSADTLGQFDGTTISESLRRAPGIAFQQDIRTGDGSNVIVRGFGPDFNTVALNGLRLPEGSGVGRSPDLSNLLTESVAKITVSKSLLPSQDSSGTGGLIDIETKTPFDRPDRYLNVGVESGRSGSDFLDDSLYSLTASGTFGSNNEFGIGVSAQYRERDLHTVGYDFSVSTGEYLPLTSAGDPVTSVSQINPLSSFPFEAGVNEVYPNFVSNFNTRNTIENSSINLSGAWRPNDNTTLRFDYQRFDQVQDLYNSALNVGTRASYELSPIAELGGEQRAALVWAPDNSNGGPLNISQQYQVTQDRELKSDVFSLRGDWNARQWATNYKLGYTSGEFNDPNEWSLLFSGGADLVPLADLQTEALQNEIDGRIVHPYAPRAGSGFPLPLLTANGFDQINDPARYALSGGALSDGIGENDRYTLELSTRREFESSVLKYLEFGVFGERAKFSRINTSNSVITTFGNPLGVVGLEFSGENLGRIGLNSGFDVVRENDMLEFLRILGNTSASSSEFSVLRVPSIPALLDVIDIPSFIANGDRNIILVMPPNDPRRFDTFTEEEEIAPYLQGRLEFGRLELVGGARISRVAIQAVNLTNPTFRDENGVPDLEFAERFRVLVDQRATQTEVLPRLLLNYRHSKNFIARAGYFKSIARPSIFDLSSEQTVSLDLQEIHGPAANQPSLFVREGNPDLEPAITDSYDLSFEHYSDDIGVAKLSFFYKETKNFLENNRVRGVNLLDNVELPDDPRFETLPQNLFVEVNRPTNSEDNARLWGVEAAYERQLSFLPGFWEGFGVYANYIYTESSKSQVFEYFDPNLGEFALVTAPDVPYAQQPEYSGTFALTYNGYGVDASISYTKQDRRLNLFQEHNLHIFDEADDTLDFRFEYRLDRDEGLYRFYLEGADLLKGASDSDVEQSRGGLGPTPKIFTGGRFYGGRIIRFGISGTF